MMQKNCYLIGDPVSQSPSPHIMNAAFLDKKLDYNYSLLCVSKEKLGTKAIDILSRPEVLLFNVTVPHKTTILQYLAELDNEASQIGSASCVLNREGHLIGHNTDFYGFSKALDKYNLSLKGERVDVLGAGGAARAAVYSLIKKGAYVRVLNRTIDNALDLASRFECRYGSLDLAGTKPAKLVVNTTKVGMVPNVSEAILTVNQLKAYENVADIVYNPEETELLKRAKIAGSNPLHGFGLEMLISLFEKTFEIGTGIKPNRDLMFKVAKERLRQ
jgi:shikimate dehydrogenase